MYSSGIAEEAQRQALYDKHAELLQCGVECGQGWFALIDDMLSEMTQRMQSAGVGLGELHIRQIKEKFGTLRCYYAAPVNLADIVARAEVRSALTCERCGAIGRVQGRVAIACLCERCARDAGFMATQLAPEKAFAGLQIELEARGGDTFTVSLIDPEKADRPFKRRAHRNDVGLAVAELIQRMLDDGDSDPERVTLRLVPRR